VTTNLSNVLALPFAEIWAEDFEWVPKPGERHDVVCYGARELRSGRTLRLWRDQLGPTSPNRTDDQALFLSFVFNAEGVSRLSLGWELPSKVIDLSPLFRCVVNGRLVPQGKGLLGALAYYNIPSVDVIYKDAIRKLHHARLAVHANGASGNPQIPNDGRRSALPVVLAADDGTRV
jgi:DNA polymerase I